MLEAFCMVGANAKANVFLRLHRSNADLLSLARQRVLEYCGV